MNAAKRIRRAALYLRVSTDKQTVQNQEVEVRQVAEQRGWDVVETYSDAGISGAKGRKDRPGLDRILNDARRGKPSHMRDQPPPPKDVRLALAVLSFMVTVADRSKLRLTLGSCSRNFTGSGHGSAAAASGQEGGPPGSHSRSNPEPFCAGENLMSTHGRLHD